MPKKWQRSRKSPRNCHHRGEPPGGRRKREGVEEASNLHWSLCIPNIPCIMDGQHTPAERDWDWYTEHLSVMKTEIRLNQQSDNSFFNDNNLHSCPLHITGSRIHLGSKPDPRDPTKERNGWKNSEQQLSCSSSYCKLLTLEQALYFELIKCGNTIVTGIRPKKISWELWNSYAGGVHKNLPLRRYLENPSKGMASKACAAFHHLNKDWWQESRVRNGFETWDTWTI